MQLSAQPTVLLLILILLVIGEAWTQERIMSKIMIRRRKKT